MFSPPHYGQLLAQATQKLLKQNYRTLTIRNAYVSSSLGPNSLDESQLTCTICQQHADDLTRSLTTTCETRKPSDDSIKLVTEPLKDSVTDEIRATLKILIESSALTTETNVTAASSLPFHLGRYSCYFTLHSERSMPDTTSTPKCAQVNDSALLCHNGEYLTLRVSFSQENDTESMIIGDYILPFVELAPAILDDQQPPRAVVSIHSLSKAKQL